MQHSCPLSVLDWDCVISALFVERVACGTVEKPRGHITFLDLRISYENRHSIHVKIGEVRKARIVLIAAHKQGHDHNSLQVQMVDIHLLFVGVYLRIVGSKCEPYEHRSSFYPRGASILASLAKNQHLSGESQGKRATEGKRSSVTTRMVRVRLPLVPALVGRGLSWNSMTSDALKEK
jgi:hypothetical protein